MAAEQIIDGKIRNRVAGDHWTIRLTVIDLPSANTITNAWFTVKEHILDVDSAAVVQKEITLVDVPGTGCIEDNGSGDGVGKVRIDLVPDDTKKFKPNMTYEWDMQIKTNSNKINTPDNARGTLIAISQVTQDE